MNVFDLFAKLSLDTSEYEKSIDSASKKANDWKTALGNAGKVIASTTAVAGGLAAAGFKFASNTAKQADEIDKMSQKLGLSSKAYQEWDYVLNLAGTSMTNMSTGLKTLTNKIDDAKNGSDSAIEMFEKLGISMEDLNSMSREDIFAATITGFQNMADSTERAALANDLYGKSGQELTPLFNQTAEETQRLIEQINDLGGVMSDDAVKAGAQFNDSLTTMKASFGGVVNSLAGELLPSFTSLMDTIAQFIGDGGLQGIINTVQTLIPIVEVATSAFVAYKVAVAAMSIISALQSATESMTIAQYALNLAMNMNPIAIVIAAITALVAAIVILWNKNEGFRNALIKAWDAIKSTITNTVNAIKTFFTQTIPNAVDNALEALKRIPQSALSWGKDLIDNFIAGINAKIQALKDKVMQVAQTVRDFIGFSEPKEGPLSNFHTYAPDMMNLFMQGIEENKGKLLDTVTDAFNFGNVGTIGYQTADTSSYVTKGASDPYNLREQIVSAFSEVSVYLDGDAMVGRLAPKMDESLGQLQYSAARGI